MSVFGNPIFSRCPALMALEKTPEPKPEHVRACLLELARHIARLPDEDERLGEALLMEAMERFPESKALKAYKKGIICPSEAAKSFFDEIAGG